MDRSALAWMTVCAAALFAPDPLGWITPGAAAMFLIVPVLGAVAMLVIALP
jgi:hypothetical protein